MVPRALALLLWASSLSSPLSGQGSTAAGEIVKISDGVYARVVDPDGGAVSNSGFVVLGPGVLVFDTHFTAEEGVVLAGEIRKVTSAPVRFVVNSHFHPDHSHGNQAFIATTGLQPDLLGTIQTRRAVLQKDVPAYNRSLSVAATQVEKLRQDLAATPDGGAAATLRDRITERQSFLNRMRGLRIQAPLQTVDTMLRIDGGDQSVELRYLGRAHTDGDLVLVIPSARVVFAGDLFYGDALPAAQDAFLLDWINTLGELLEIDADTFIPGHGRPSTRDGVKRFLKYLQDLKALVAPAVANATPVEAAVRDLALPGDYSGFRFQNFFAANVQKMYLELRAGSTVAAPASDPGKKSVPAKPQ